MNIINKIEKAIEMLDGGEYQKLMDAYLVKKFKFENIHPLGVQTGTNKTTKGTPDSYVECSNGKYILIMHGSVTKDAYKKMKEDILSCIDTIKLKAPVEKIEKIICTYISTNLNVGQLDSLKNLVDNVEIELIGIGTVAHDIAFNYPVLATKFLDVTIGSGQLFDIDEFIEHYDAGGMNAPLKIELVSREKEISDLKTKIMDNDVILVSGASGIGKTKLVLETCRQIQKENDVNVVCVKNNGQMLYDDVRETIEQPGKYLLFLDDANQTINLNSIFEFCVSKKIDCNFDVKIVMTVRDYAKEPIKNLTLNRLKFEEMQLKALSEESIRSILTKELEIRNEYYLRQIIKISNGNIRLAILAAIAAKKHGYKSIGNAIDIFRNFYSQIFSDNKITEKQVIVLFAISIFGPVSLNSNDGIEYVLELNNISKIEYIDICHYLHNCELLDIYENSIVRVVDQSFANYVLEYVLIEKKTVSIKELLLNKFPKYSSKLIYAINTILNLFNSDETMEYVVNEINAAWVKCCVHDEKEYVKVFKSINEEKALLYAKRIIDKTESVLCDLNAVNFLEEIKNVYEKDEAVQILSSFSESKYYKMAVDLLLLYFSKRQDIAKEICYGITERMLSNIYSNEQNFNIEKYFTLKLYDMYKESKNQNFAILLICVINKILDYEIRVTEQEMTPNRITLVTYYKQYSLALVKHRRELMKCLKELREEDSLKEVVDVVVSNLRTRGAEEAKNIFSEDVSTLHHLYDDGVYIPDLNLCVVFGKLVNHMRWLDLNTAEIELFICKNKEYVIYRQLVGENVKTTDWDVEENNKKKVIKQLIEKYGYDDFLFLFSICKKSLMNKVSKDWCLQDSIDFIFDSLRDDTKKYLLAMKAYFVMNTPYLFRANDKMTCLFNLLGEDEIKLMFNSLDEVNRLKWETVYYEELPSNKITKDTVLELFDFIKMNDKFKYFCFPSIFSLSKYKNKGIDIVELITEYFLHLGEKKPYLIEYFFGRVLDDEDTQKIIDFFNGDAVKILRLYVIAMRNRHFDYNGNLLLWLIKLDVNNWNEITKEYYTNKNSRLSNNIIDKIWMQDNYFDLINIAYNNKQYSYYRYIRNEKNTKIFSPTGKDNLLINERIDLWIKEFIKKNISTTDKIEDIFDIVADVFQNKRIEYLKVFLEKNNDISLFKRVALFPSHRSWSGSEVPLIEQDIDFLNNLLDEITGIDYLEHILYIKDLIERKKEQKQEVLKKEYIESFSSA